MKWEEDLAAYREYQKNCVARREVALNINSWIKMREQEMTDAGYDSLPGAAEDRRTSEAAARRRSK